MPQGSKLHYVYILQGSNNRYYTGMTGDLTKRFKQHEKGQCNSTKYNRPLLLIWATITQNRHSARRLEKNIKHCSAKKFLLQQKYKANRPYKNIL